MVIGLPDYGIAVRRQQMMLEIFCFTKLNLLHVMTMKAVVLKKIVDKYSDRKQSLSECLEVKEVPKPVPGWGQVLVKIQRTQVGFDPD